MVTDSIESIPNPREFISKFGHELRTPIHGILGATELALEENLPACVRDYLLTAKSSAETLLQFLNEIIEFFELESVRLELQVVPFGLRAVMNEVVEACSVAASEKGLAILCDVAAPDNLIGDASRLRQVLTSLLNNAIKFTDHGRVELRFVAETQSAKETHLRVEVSDTGIGISSGDQQLIFKPFTQVNSSSTRCRGGAGLGLATATRWVQLMGGQLGVRSTPGRGSTFFFRVTLPRAPQVQAETQSESSPEDAYQRPGMAPIERSSPSRSVRVLLAEDTVASQKIVKGILSKRGHAVEIAHNGREAIEMFRAQPYDIVLMDIQMPIIDGMQATAAIRAFEFEPDRRVPIVAMTAHVMPGDRERCLAAGMDAYLGKPVKTLQLIDVVEALSLRGDRVDSAAPAKPPCSGAAYHRLSSGDLHVFDVDAALKRLGNDRQLFADLLDFFLEDYPILMDRLRQALQDRDPAATALASHSLKGLAANFDAVAVVETAAALEKSGHDGDWAAVTRLAETLELQISRLRDGLIEYRSRAD